MKRISVKKVLFYRLLNLGISVGIGFLISYSIAIINALRYNHPLIINSSIILASIMVFLVFIESIGFISGKIDKRISWKGNIKKRYWIQIFIITPYGILFGIVGSLLVSIFIAKDRFFDGFEIAYFLFIGFLVSLIYCNVQFIYNYLNSNRFSELNKLRFEKEDAEVKFQSLKDQLSPHFLFNNLNTLHGLINENHELASDFVLKLSDIYRYVLLSKDKEVVTLKSEMEFIDKYLRLMKIRYGSNFITNISVNIDFEKFLLPPLTLQILIENVQKHNFIDEDNPIIINVYNEKDEFLIVENNINKPIKNVTALNSGLLNLKSRYSFLTNKEIEILSINNTFKVKLPLIQIE